MRRSVAAARRWLEIIGARARRGERLEPKDRMRRRHDPAKARFIGRGLNLKQGAEVWRRTVVLRVSAPNIVELQTDIGLRDIANICRRAYRVGSKLRRNHARIRGTAGNDGAGD